MARMIYLLSTLILTVFAEPIFEDDVMVLTDDNFDEEIVNHYKLLIKFYTPWCGHSKRMAPDYAAAAKQLKENDPPIYMAKVDASKNP